MTGRRSRRADVDTPAPSPARPAPDPQALPGGRVPSVGVRELVGALQRRRSRRREAAAGLSQALRQLSGAVEAHLARIAELRTAVEQQGGDLAHLEVYDSAMARLRAELRATERALAAAFHAAAHGQAG